MRKQLRILIMGVSAALLCGVLAYGYWVDVIVLKCQIPVLYPTEITLTEELPAEETAAPDSTMLGAPLSDESAPEQGVLQEPPAPEEPENQPAPDVTSNYAENTPIVAE